MKITKDFKGITLSADGRSYEVYEFNVCGDVEIDLDLPLHVLGKMYVTRDMRSTTSLVVEDIMNIQGFAFVRGNVVCNDRLLANALEVGGNVKAKKKITANTAVVYGCIECEEMEVILECTCKSLIAKKIKACNCTCGKLPSYEDKQL